MSFIGSLFNPSQGAGFQAQSANLQTPVTAEQATQAYTQASDAIKRQQDLVAALQGQGGIQNQMAAMQQLQAQAAGTGPNPALQQLQNTTGQNVANQAALMAGQRGAGANAGLLARQIGQQGANIQQQAAGQGAFMQAEQQRQAQQAMAALAAQQVAQQMQGGAQLMQGTQGLQQNLLSGIQGQNQAQIQNTEQQNRANAAIAQQNAKHQAGMFGQVAGALGAALTGPLGSLFASSGTSGGMPGVADMGVAKGGPQMQMQAFGGETQPGPRSSIGQAFKNMKAGGQVPGQAQVKGDSYANDTVPAKLSPGEIVIPRSITQGADAPAKAAAFVQAILAKKGL